VPEGIDDDEIRDMVEDGCASASASAAADTVVVVCRLRGNSPVLDLPLQEALEAILDRGMRQARGESAQAAAAVVVVESGDATTAPAPSDDEDDDAVPVLLFSGFRDDEMRSVYGLLGREINAEARSISGGAFQQSSASVAACAKAVPNAMSKPLRQVLSEVAGDHRDAAGLLPGEKDGTAR
jgi:hypothetical protein